MVQLKILSGKKAGGIYVARRFPVRLGRSPAADLRLEDDGIWDQHLQIEFAPGEGFLLRASPDAMVTLNGQPVEQQLLRNGNEIGMGAVKLQFWLAPAPQLGLGFREWLTWSAIAAICLGQVALIYWLLS
jgi:pSer/pThr/pTyr-binding forkhead associated (FHA) protein